MRQRRAKNGTKKPICAVCMYEIDEETKCRKCKELFHKSCINDLCVECEQFIIKEQQDKEEDDEMIIDIEGDICVLCDGECTCENAEPVRLLGSRSTAGKKRSRKGKSNLNYSSSDSEIDYEEDRFWVAESEAEEVSGDETGDLFFSSSSSESCYEEPGDFIEENQSEEDIMVEIVREKLLNGWSSEEEEEVQGSFTFEEMENSDDFDDFDEFAVYLETPSKEAYSKEPLSNLVMSEFNTPSASDQLDFTNVSTGNSLFNSQVDLTPKHTTPIPANSTNPWFALAAMDMNNSLLKSSIKTPGSTKAFDFSSTSSILKRPVAFNSVANTSFLGSPSIRMISDIKKKEFDKLYETLGKNGKEAASIKESIPQELSLDDILEGVSEHVESEEEPDSPETPRTPATVEKHRRVPIGTFWQSQRKNRNKRKDLLRAVKKSAARKLLDATLLEALPMKAKKRKSINATGFWASPSFGPEDISSSDLAKSMPNLFLANF